jgi:hypothetical protein
MIGQKGQNKNLRTELKEVEEWERCENILGTKLKQYLRNRSNWSRK